MELTVREWLTVLAMVDRLYADNLMLARHLEQVTDVLAKKGLLTQDEKAELAHAAKAHRDRSRQTRSAENEPGDPGGAPFYAELSRELRLLGVLSDNPTIGDTLPDNFEDILQKVLERFRRNREDGDAGRTMNI